MADVGGSRAFGMGGDAVPEKQFHGATEEAILIDNPFPCRQTTAAIVEHKVVERALLPVDIQFLYPAPIDTIAYGSAILEGLAEIIEQTFLAHSSIYQHGAHIHHRTVTLSADIALQLGSLGLIVYKHHFLQGQTVIIRLFQTVGDMYLRSRSHTRIGFHIIRVVNIPLGAFAPDGVILCLHTEWQQTEEGHP